MRNEVSTTIYRSKVRSGDVAEPMRAKYDVLDPIRR